MQQFRKQSLDESHLSRNVSCHNENNQYRQTITIHLYRYLHDAIPVIAGGHTKQCQECHTEILEMSMFPKTLTWMFFITF